MGCEKPSHVWVAHWAEGGAAARRICCVNPLHLRHHRSCFAHDSNLFSKTGDAHLLYDPAGVHSMLLARPLHKDPKAAKGKGCHRQKLSAAMPPLLDEKTRLWWGLCFLMVQPDLLGCRIRQEAPLSKKTHS